MERPSLDGSRDGDVAKWSKAAVCKTAIHRFESGRRLHFAGVAKLASARDLKSCARKGRESSNLSPGIFLNWLEQNESVSEKKSADGHQKGGCMQRNLMVTAAGALSCVTGGLALIWSAVMAVSFAQGGGGPLLHYRFGKGGVGA